MKTIRILIYDLCNEKNKKSSANYPMSKSQKACENHADPVRAENRPKPKNLKTYENDLNPLSVEDRPKSEILKTILMIPVLVLLSVLLLLNHGIFLPALYKPVLIDMPGSHYPEPLHLLKNESAGISTETQLAGEYTNTGPISVYAHLLDASGKSSNPFRRMI